MLFFSFPYAVYRPNQKARGLLLIVTILSVKSLLSAIASQMSQAQFIAT
nr:MAG TPA: hypothetical protein [Caudoviricetes sp.]